jgi:hypothetical protein
VLFVGLDDTDNLESRGTGHLARCIAAVLAEDARVLGVTRHQLLVDPRVPYTRNNSCAAVLVENNGRLDLQQVLVQVQALVLDDFQAGSDPGVCVAQVVPAEVITFGCRAKRELVTQAEARALAAAHDIPLLGLGGDEGGVIGALAAVGLAASQTDGRYPLVGRSRELSGLQPVSAVLEAGISEVRTPEGQVVREGLVQCDKLRPARRDGRPVLFVEWADGFWMPLKLD